MLRPNVGIACFLQKGSLCGDLMPKLLSLLDVDPKDTPIKVIVKRKPLSQADENRNTNTNSNIGSMFFSMQSKINTKLDAIKNIDKKVVKNRFNTNVESLKEQMRAILDG